MKQKSALVLCFMISGSLHAAVTLDDLRDVIEKGDIGRFKELVKDVIYTDSENILQSTFFYKIDASRNAQDLSLFMFALLLKKMDIAEYILTVYPELFALDHKVRLKEGGEITSLNLLIQSRESSNAAEKKAFAKLMKLLLDWQDRADKEIDFVQRLRNAIESGEAGLFSRLVKRIISIGKTEVLKSTFAYTLRNENRSLLTTKNLTLLMLAVTRRNVDIVEYIAKNYPKEFDINYSAYFDDYDDEVESSNNFTANAYQLLEFLSEENPFMSWARFSPEEKETFAKMKAALLQALPPRHDISSFANGLPKLRGAIEEGRVDVFKNAIEKLIKASKDAVCKEKFPYTVRESIVTQELSLLMLAVLRGRIDIVKYMATEKSALFDINYAAQFTTIGKKTALQLAQSIRNNEGGKWSNPDDATKNALDQIIDILKKAGAK